MSVAKNLDLGAAAPCLVAASASRIAIEYASSPVAHCRHPHTDLIVGVLAADDIPDHRLQCREGGRIAEEPRHADQQFTEEQVELDRCPAQKIEIVGRVVDLKHLHAALDAADHCVPLVFAEIMTEFAA